MNKFLKLDPTNTELLSQKQKLLKEASQSKMLNDMKAALQKQGLLEEFDEMSWNTLVEKIRVQSKKDISMVFKDGTEVKIEV